MDDLERRCAKTAVMAVARIALIVRQTAIAVFLNRPISFGTFLLKKITDK